MADYEPKFPGWTHTAGAMLAHRTGRVRAYCGECRRGRAVNLRRLVERKGADYSLINRRTRCRFTPGCMGVVYFHFHDVADIPLVEERALRAWREQDLASRVADWQRWNRGNATPPDY